ncbi:hypothetical protein ACJRO7_002586 [Eucalyptus globulus]|uniref:Uncharacterized protein n=1 Tax=Eucalyptus globulus TaxID=34317 RepID=A0ABD3M0G5_EUCGL
MRTSGGRGPVTRTNGKIHEGATRGAACGFRTEFDGQLVLHGDQVEKKDDDPLPPRILPHVVFPHLAPGEIPIMTSRGPKKSRIAVSPFDSSGRRQRLPWPSRSCRPLHAYGAILSQLVHRDFPAMM